MSFLSSNMHYVFHVEYFRNLNLLTKSDRDAAIIRRRNQDIRTFLFPKSGSVVPAPFSELRDMPGFHSFSLYTTYPGLLIGTGNPHETALDGAVKCGFSLDYVTGLPYIPGSSLKGLLRSSFPGTLRREPVQDAETAKMEAEAKEELIRDFLNQENLNVRALEDVIFGSDDPEEKKFQINLECGDVFLGAFPVSWPDSILEMEFITPHKEKFSDPIPISIMKIRPNVRMEFAFLLHDSPSTGVSAEEKAELFRQLLLESGAGAKTNVGFGRLAENPAPPNVIGYNQDKYDEMDAILRSRSSGAADMSKSRRPAPPSSRSHGQRRVLGKCPNCGSDIIAGERFPPSCTGKCGFRLGRPPRYRNSITDGEYEKLLHGETVLLRGFEDGYGGRYDANVRLTGVKDPQTDVRTGETVCYGWYRQERILP